MPLTERNADNKRNSLPARCRESVRSHQFPDSPSRKPRNPKPRLRPAAGPRLARLPRPRPRFLPRVAPARPRGGSSLAIGRPLPGIPEADGTASRWLTGKFASASSRRKSDRKRGASASSERVGRKERLQAREMSEHWGEREAGPRREKRTGCGKRVCRR